MGIEGHACPRILHRAGEPDPASRIAGRRCPSIPNGFAAQAPAFAMVGHPCPTVPTPFAVETSASLPPVHTVEPSGHVSPWIPDAQGATQGTWSARAKAFRIEGASCPSNYCRFVRRTDRITPRADRIAIDGHACPANSGPIGHEAIASGTKEKTTMPKLGKVTKRARATNIIGGLRKHFGAPSYTLGGKVYTQSQLIKAFQSHVDSLDEVDAMRAALAAAVAKERELAKRIGALARYLKMNVEGRFGQMPTIYADFGWEMPKKPGPKTVKAKLEGMMKVRETRKARKTMGKRQRRKVKGW